MTPVVEVILPNDMPWVFRAGVLYGDDESLDFQQRGYPAPGWGFQPAPDGSKLLYAASTHYQAYTTVTTVQVVNADGTNDQALELGGQGARLTYF